MNALEVQLRIEEAEVIANWGADAARESTTPSTSGVPLPVERVLLPVGQIAGVQHIELAPISR